MSQADIERELKGQTLLKLSSNEDVLAIAHARRSTATYVHYAGRPTAWLRACPLRTVGPESTVPPEGAAGRAGYSRGLQAVTQHHVVRAGVPFDVEEAQPRHRVVERWRASAKYDGPDHEV